MKVCGMVAPWLIVGVAAVVAPDWAAAQDSGPGPVPPATEAVYDVTLIRFFSNLEGTFVFFAGESDEGTLTSGEFEAEVGGQFFVGTWQAVDAGSFAVWSATASGETSTLIASGFATPDFLVGQAVTNVNSLTFRSYLLIGEAAPVVEEPMTPE